MTQAGCIQLKVTEVNVNIKIFSFGGGGGGKNFLKLHVIFDYCLPVISMNASFQSKKNLTSKQLFPSISLPSMRRVIYAAVCCK